MKFGILQKELTESFRAKQSLLNSSKEIEFAINLIYKTIKYNKKILICGNGGSAADAQHLAAEFLVRLNPSINRKPFPILNLLTDTSTITACANDLGFESIFERNLEAFGKKGDALIALSTSGNSKNILKVLKKAKNIGIYSISFLGNKGGKAKKYSDLSLVVNSDNTARIQESHIFLGHHILNQVEKKLLRKNN
jgi:D-sedoheptulose 7-phosphate isomerase